MKYFITLLVLGVLFIGCQKNKPAEETSTIATKSIVCEMCVKTIKTALYKIDGVKDVEVDLEKKVTTVKFIPLQTNLETIERAITEAGYDANDRKRDPDAYSKLSECCKIDG